MCKVAVSDRSVAEVEFERTGMMVSPRRWLPNPAVTVGGTLPDDALKAAKTSNVH